MTNYHDARENLSALSAAYQRIACQQPLGEDAKKLLLELVRAMTANTKVLGAEDK